MRESLLRCIRDGLEEINSTRDEKISTDALDQLHFYGDGGMFDSMQLINFLMVVEEKLADQLGVAITIVSEKAVSRKVSPFANVSTLLDYLLEELGDAA
jgi:acyl carrier protein